MTLLIEKLQKDLLNGFYKPGTRLNISEIKEHYGISLAPVREALSELATKGLLIKEPNKGYRVPKLSKQELLDLYAISSHLELLAVEQSILRSTDFWEEDILTSLYQLKKIESQEKKPEFKKWSKANLRFHNALIANSSSHLKELLCLTALKTERYVRAAHAHVENSFFQFAHEHEKIAEAVLAKDIQKAQELLKKHAQKGQQILINNYKFED